jgi:hypothetical protein
MSSTYVYIYKDISDDAICSVYAKNTNQHHHLYFDEGAVSLLLFL